MAELNLKQKFYYDRCKWGVVDGETYWIMEKFF